MLAKGIFCSRSSIISVDQTQSDKADTVVEVAESNDMFDFPYSKKQNKRGSKGTSKLGV